MNLLIDVADERWKRFVDLELVAEKTCFAAAAAIDGEISVLFTDDVEMQSLNRTWRGKDTSTNVLSFPAAQSIALPKGQTVPLGDIVLAYETVAQEINQSGKPALHHVAHLLVHGVLHLLGYDHDNDDDAMRMENKEREILAQFEIPDPYHT